MLDGFPSWVKMALVLLPLVVCIGLLALVMLCERYPFFAQFVKYGTNGVIATYVQTGVFYALAVSWLACLGADDSAVVNLGFPAAAVSDGVRALRFSAATATGFVVANVACWLMNRWCVFTPGKYKWYVEFGMFFGASTFATALALGVSAALINWCGMMTTAAVFLEIAVSFVVNFFARKFFIFKG